MKEFILVEFDDLREVLIDGNASGYNTGDVIDLVPGTHTISLEGPDDFAPTEQAVNPSGTSPVQPHVLGPIPPKPAGSAENWVWADESDLGKKATDEVAHRCSATSRSASTVVSATH